MMREVWDREKTEKVCAIDLDGVLVDYPKCWIDYINKETPHTFTTLTTAKEVLSYAEYKTLKAKYRTSGYKRTLPAIKGASKFIKDLQEKGYQVVILTSRPYRLYRRIWRDTVDWLNDHDIKPDGIIWEAEKHWAVLKEFPYLKFLVEDNAKLGNQVAKLGYKVYILDNEYNRQKLENNCSRVFRLDDIIRSEICD